MSKKTLFFEKDWFSVREYLKKKTLEAIQRIDESRLLSNSETDLVTYYTSEFQFIVPILDRENAEISTHETQLDVSRDPRRFFSKSGPFYVPATEFIVKIPFDGRADAFSVKPSRYNLNPPRAEISGQYLVLSVVQENHDEMKLRQLIESQIADINSWLNVLRNDASSYNSEVEGIVKQEISSRKTKILGAKNIAASLGFKIAKRPGESKSYASSVVKRKIQPVLPNPDAAPFKPEPELVNEDYTYILSVLENMSLVMEKSPEAFKNIDEEALRFHFLFQLNGHFEGNATGETFNSQGKTDILIKDNGRNIFIAECKFWDGPKKHSDTINQILSYSTWRDTKVAVLVFNRNKNFSNVLESIEQVTRNHPHCKKVIGKRSETSFQYVFGSLVDPNRDLILTVMAFDIP